MKIPWGRLASQLGLVYCVAGLFLVFLGWNGAATYDRVAAQIPYVVSGGLGGLSLVVIGAAVLTVQNARADRAALESTLLDVREALERMAATGVGRAGAMAGTTAPDAGMVVAGPTAYHRPTCRLVEGQTSLTTMSADDATATGLTPCRACRPDESAAVGPRSTASTM